MTTSTKAETGVVGLDDILGGGLQRGRVYLIEGSPGTGKTTIATQFLLTGAAASERGLYITMSETEEELRESAGAGVDRMSGGFGSDTYVVDNAGDRAVEGSTTGGTDVVRSLVSFTLGARVENLTLTGEATANGTGNALANVIAGNGGANILSPEPICSGSTRR